MTLPKTLRAFALLACVAGLPGCPHFGDLMRLYGYTELLPPSTLLSPGAMVIITKKSPMQLKLLCGPRASLGPNWAPATSATVTRSLEKHTGKTFHLSANVLEAIKANAEFSTVKDIIATLANPKLVELEDLDIVANLRYRSPECQRAVDLRQKNGFKVTMISSGLMGDVTYLVKFENTGQINVKARLEQMQHLAIEIGAGNSYVTENTIKATNLTYGVKDDAYLSSLTLTEVDETKVERGSRVIPVEEIGRVDLTPDAPIVPPPRGWCENGTCPEDGKFDAGLVPIVPRETHRSSVLWKRPVSQGESDAT